MAPTLTRVLVISGRRDSSSSSSIARAAVRGDVLQYLIGILDKLLQIGRGNKYLGIGLACLGL